MKKAKANARPDSSSSEKSKFYPPLPILGRLRQTNEETVLSRKPKLGIWRKQSTAEVSIATISSVGSSTFHRSAEPARRRNSTILKCSSSFEPEVVYPPQEFLIKCPMFRRALRSMRYCGKQERPRLEGWVAFRKGNALQTLISNNQLCRSDFRYIALTAGAGVPTLHVMMTSKKDANGASVDGIENLVLKKHIKIVVSRGNHKRCLGIVDSRNNKVIATFMPVLINEDLFTDGSKACLVSDIRFAKIMSGLVGNQSGFVAESRMCLADDGQIDAANHARFVLDCEMKR